MRFLAVSLICIAMMVMDRHHQSQLSLIRYYFSAVAAPLQYAADYPIKLAYWAKGSFSSYKNLLRENTNLKAEHLLLQAQVQQYTALEKENRQLRQLLQSSPRESERVLIAELLSVDMDPEAQKFVLSKGSNDGVHKGQAVLDATGVFGQIVQVGPLTSSVLLLTDTQSAIPILDNRTGERAIAVGRGNDGLLELRHVAKTTSIKVGDVLLTSGLGQRFPVGYPVGKVVRVNHNPGETFASIEVEPTAQFNRSRLVLLVWLKTDAKS